MPNRKIPNIPHYKGKDGHLSDILDKLKQAIDHIINDDFVTEKDIFCKDLITAKNSIYIGSKNATDKLENKEKVLYWRGSPISSPTSGIGGAGAGLAAHQAQHKSGAYDALNHDQLAGFVADEHIDWTNAVADFLANGTMKIGDVANGHYVEIESDGTLVLHGDARVYEDLQVSISNIRVPTSSAPTERLYNHGIGGGVTFPVLGFAVNEYIYFDVQTSHSMDISTVLENHLHFMTPTDGSGTPDRFQFQLDVIAAAINGSWAVPSGSPFTSEHIIAADYSNAHKLLEMGDIPAVNTTVSTIYKCKLTRIAATANEYGQEVYLEFTDCHYLKNTMGSRLEGSK